MSTPHASPGPHAQLQAIIALHQQGRLADAERACRELLAQHGELVEAQHLLALLLHMQGRSVEALPWFERAAAVRGDPRLWTNHAAALLAAGRAREAATVARRAVDADPRQPGAWLNLGLALELDHDFSAATAALEQALRLAESLPARRALARCRLRAGDPAAALHALAPVSVRRDVLSDLLRAEAEIALGNLDAADALLGALTNHAPSAVSALTLSARIAALRGRHAQEHALLQRVLACDPDNRHAHVQSALIQLNRGDADVALDALHAWLEVHPDDQVAASNYLIACNYSERIDAPGLLAEHRRLRPQPAVGAPWSAERRPSAATGRTRIGWIAAHFGGLLEIFFADVLSALRELAPEFEHRLYAVAPQAAPSSAPFADAQALGALDDAALLQRLRDERLDIGIDMIGRAAGNRAAVLAARIAPVQIGWIDQFQPSGIDAIDGLLTDPWLSPAGSDAYFSERLLRLPHGRLAYSPPPAAPIDMDAAAEKRFVSLNRFPKLSASVIAVWATILRELPDWSLLLKAKGGDDAELAELYRGRFVAHGIHASRIDIRGAGPYAEAMETYQEAAIALDPFPFSGCSTSCDALWMGLPVITWPRQTIASRQTAALLAALGIDAWTAHSAEDYVAKAVALARDEPARRAWRVQARQRVHAALCDAPRLARELLAEFRALTAR